MERFFEDNVDIKTLSPLTLAYIGDGVYELMMREHLLGAGNCPAGKMHARTVARVRAEAQAEAIERILPVLTENEQAVFRRGRNAHSGRRIPQKASVEQYHLATGLEALFGWLYLQGNMERLRELFALACSG